MSRYNRSLKWAGKQFTNRVLQDISYPIDAGYCQPSRILLCMTLRCNLRCPQCAIWRTEPPPELSTEEWKTVFTKLRDWLGPHRVQIAGGEIFLRKDVVELVQFAIKQGITIGIVSNATLLNQKIAEQLVDAGLGFMDISLDGIRPETHNYLRGAPKGVYDKAVSALRYFRRHMEKTGNDGMSLTVATVISGKNIDELVDILDLVENEKLSGIMYNPIGPASDSEAHWYEGNELWPKKEDLPKLERVLDELISRKRNGAPILNSDDQLMAMKSYFQRPEENLYGARQCRAGQTNFLMSADGNVHFCLHMPPIGNHTDDFPTMWRSAKANEVRQQIKSCAYECSPSNFQYRRSILKEIQRYLQFR